MPDEYVPPSGSLPRPAEPATPPVTLAKEAPAASATTTSLPSNLGAALCALLPLIGGVAFLILEKKDALTRFWAMQSLIFGSVWFVQRIAFWVVGMLLYSVFRPLGWLWWLVALIVGLGFVVIWIYSIYQAFIGKRWEIPFIGPVAKQQLAKMGPQI